MIASTKRHERQLSITFGIAMAIGFAMALPAAAQQTGQPQPAQTIAPQLQAPAAADQAGAPAPTLSAPAPAAQSGPAPQVVTGPGAPGGSLVRDAVAQGPQAGGEQVPTADVPVEAAPNTEAAPGVAAAPTTARVLRRGVPVGPVVHGPRHVTKGYTATPGSQYLPAHRHVVPHYVHGGYGYQRHVVHSYGHGHAAPSYRVHHRHHGYGHVYGHGYAPSHGYGAGGYGYRH